MWDNVPNIKVESGAFLLFIQLQSAVNMNVCESITTCHVKYDEVNQRVEDVHVMSRESSTSCMVSLTDESRKSRSFSPRAVVLSDVTPRSHTGIYSLFFIFYSHSRFSPPADEGLPLRFRGVDVFIQPQAQQ